MVTPNGLNVMIVLSKDGRWLFIDAAEGDKSWHWPECENVKSRCVCT